MTTFRPLRALRMRVGLPRLASHSLSSASPRLCRRKRPSTIGIQFCLNRREHLRFDDLWFALEPASECCQTSRTFSRPARARAIGRSHQCERRVPFGSLLSMVPRRARHKDPHARDRAYKASPRLASSRCDAAGLNLRDVVPISELAEAAHLGAAFIIPADQGGYVAERCRRAPGFRFGVTASPDA